MEEIMYDVGYSNMREMVKHCLWEIQTKTAKNIVVSGIPSGFESLDELTDGFQKGKVYVVGGRPCMGKEELMISPTSAPNIITFSIVYKVTNYLG
jgi:replicative DNA helicase